MLILLWLFWILINGRATADVLICGAVLSGCIYFFCVKFLGYSLKRELALLRSAGKIQRYIGLLCREILQANLSMIRVIWGHKKEINPRLVFFKTPLKGTFKTILADSITVTPGTITVLCDDEGLAVHCLNESYSDGIENTSFQQILQTWQEETK